LSTVQVAVEREESAECKYATLDEKFTDRPRGQAVKGHEEKTRSLRFQREPSSEVEALDAQTADSLSRNEQLVSAAVRSLASAQASARVAAAVGKTGSESGLLGDSDVDVDQARDADDDEVFDAGDDADQGWGHPSLRRPHLVISANPFREKCHQVWFSYPAFAGDQRLSSDVESLKDLSEKGRGGRSRALVFVITEDTARYGCVIHTLLRNGFREAEDPKTERFNLRWGKQPTEDEWRRVQWFQKVNHFPGSGCLARKDRLAFTIRAMRKNRALCAEYDFLPETFVLPDEKPQLVARAKALPAGTLWISKPPNASCGRGIRVVSRLDDLDLREEAVVSRYIANPYLINGLKFDLRLYVVATSFNPIKIYMYREGLVRFATQPYNVKKRTLGVNCMHLTNYAVNRESLDFVSNEDPAATDHGHKWSLTSFLAHMSARGVDTAKLMQDVEAVLVKTLLSMEQRVVDNLSRLGINRNSCFELYGFDVLLDADLRPWLMEVNIGPSLSCSSPMDRVIKTRLLTDIFHLACVRPVDARRIRTAAQRERERIVARLPPKRESMGGRRKGRAAGAAVSSSRATVLERLDIERVPLTDDDLNVLREFELESLRLGSFKCLFPAPGTVDHFSQILSPKRRYNVLLSKWLQLPRDRQLTLLRGVSAPLSLPPLARSPSTTSSSVSGITATSF
jgi:hypothetical protein